MAKYAVIDLQPALQIKYELQQFDAHLSQLTREVVSAKVATNTIEQLAMCLESAIQNGLDPIQTQSRTHVLTLLAFEYGYSQEEVEGLLTAYIQPNGSY